MAHGSLSASLLPPLAGSTSALALQPTHSAGQDFRFAVGADLPIDATAPRPSDLTARLRTAGLQEAVRRPWVVGDPLPTRTAVIQRCRRWAAVAHHQCCGRRAAYWAERPVSASRLPRYRMRDGGNGGIGSADRRQFHTEASSASVVSAREVSPPGLSGTMNSIGADPSQSVSMALAIRSPRRRL